MTSKWIRSAPATTTASTSAPRRAKSAESIDGAIQGCSRGGSDAGFIERHLPSFHTTRFAQQFVRGADLAGLLFGDFHHRFRQALGDELVGVILVHEPAIGLRDFAV